MFKTGSIRKIEVKNFVTYSHVELYPGPNLNMLIGPNGTGKSTIVAAIILGLGGNPKVVGRGHKVSEYVKHNCIEATINIYLQGERENEYIKITRTFTNQDKSLWALNNQRVVLKDIMDCIKTFNIQVDNLCQFLPQDRVQEFAKMNQQELLNKTQIALCRRDLVDKQQALIKCRESHQKLQEAIERNSTKLQEAQEANTRLVGKVENFNKKKEYLGMVQDIDRKTAWIQYDKMYEKMSETKEDMNRAVKVYDKYKNEAKPAEREIQRAKNLVGELQQDDSKLARSIKESEMTIKRIIEKCDQAKEGISKITNDMNSKIDEIQQRAEEMESEASKIEEMRVAQRELLAKCENNDQIQQRVQKVTAEIQKLKTHVTRLQNKKEEVMHTKQNYGAQLRSHTNEINRLENVKQQRLDYLQRIDQDAYSAVLWLRNNKQMFRGEVFEPIVLELNVLDSKNAVYLENVIPVRDRVAFTCTHKEDMNQFIRIMREEKRLTVNVLHSGNTGEHATHFQPSIPIEQLRRFGLYTYLNSLFTAPDPIMRYLCKTYRVHDIPVGNSDTNRCFEQIPKQIRVFFSDKQRYSVNYSKYTGEKIVRQNEISSDGGLSISVDILKLERLQGQINELMTNVSNYEDELKEYDSQIHLIEDQIAKLNTEMQHIRGIKQQVQNIENRINMMQNKIEEMRKSSVNPDTLRAQARRKITRVVKEMGVLQVELKSKFASLSSLTSKKKLQSLKVEKARKDVAFLENKVEESRRLMREAETTLNQIREVYANVKGRAKAALQKAKGLSKNFTPEDDGFAEFQETYNRLSSNLIELENEKGQLMSKIDCLTAADDDELQEYEDRVALIEQLQEDIEGTHMELSRNTSKMDKLQEEWLVPLKQLIAEINAKFALAFERMGCAGEVSLNTGDNEKEYSQYGLCIKVTYRNGEPLQELNSVVQSGGERAVATAAFMLSLQELTPVPFRCVDEINQGMDASNERKIFELLVEATSQPNTSQYFLITPKLVPNLKFSRSMMIHIVHNGPFVEADRKWSRSELCNPQRVQIQ